MMELAQKPWRRTREIYRYSELYEYTCTVVFCPALTVKDYVRVGRVRPYE